MVKLSSPACDWIVRGTADSRGREVLVWSTGLLDRLPPEITHPVIACARDEEGWAILMHDVSDQLIPDPLGASPIMRPTTGATSTLAALHADFWGHAEIVNPRLATAVHGIDTRCSLRRQASARQPIRTKGFA